MSSDRRPGLTSPDKHLWPATGLTKADLWDYYAAAQDRLLRAVADRPLTLKRYPNGIDHSGFFQKHLGRDAPDDLHRFTTWSESSSRRVSYLVVTGATELRWAAQMSVVELHAWLSTIDRPDQPDTLLFDLDPADDDPPVGAVALWLRELLEELGFTPRVKSSGKRGLHVCVRVERRYGFSDLRAFALALSRCLADRHPDELTVEMRKADRGDRLLIDWSRHGARQHTVAAWSPRATPNATVSAPLTWAEVADGVDPATITLRTALDRPDHWADPAPAHRIERARERLERWGYPAIDRSPRARTTM